MDEAGSLHIQYAGSSRTLQSAVCNNSNIECKDDDTPIFYDLEGVHQMVNGEKFYALLIKTNSNHSYKVDILPTDEYFLKVTKM